MRPFIPSLQSLRAFEAAARHLSFTRAAQELQLTQTAISHQIKALEDQLGIQLFVRQRNQLTLTPQAVAYLAAVHDAINLLSAATEQVRKDKVEQVLSVLCLPTYAMKCLIPALPEFQQAHPDITLRLLTETRFDAFDRNHFDVAIRYGSGRWASFQVDPLHGEEFFPVCSPQVLEQLGEFNSIESALGRMRQIRTYYYSMYQDDWPVWLKAAVPGPVRFAGEAIFHMQLTSLAAAVDGLGLALGRTPLVSADLAQGRLVRPFELLVPSASSYYLAIPHDKLKLKQVQAFRDWAVPKLAALHPTPA